ncbi:BBE domain-containing protein [Paraburkholderia sp. Ac-20347]|uniref:BBE domain-containing protein n=1 Tax=Paraburkholderia sp. Ac-20347 TaxID=2703892 RepID=UPI00197CCDF5|nr:BBE domain-containing protein [Paraburkholderia sp. Ac-20347]MBN3808628.1 hypothetical protein [Paraburkholderia sp. Ac-20347]
MAARNATRTCATRSTRRVEALIEAACFQAAELPVNKGLAGALFDVNEQARWCAMNPNIADAFALMIVAKAASVLKALSPESGAYVSETDFFRGDWREAFWGANYARLKAIKNRYDPEGFFFVHHGVGSEDWSEDGFTPVRS